MERIEIGMSRKRLARLVDALRTALAEPDTSPAGTLSVELIAEYRQRLAHRQNLQRRHGARRNYRSDLRRGSRVTSFLTLLALVPVLVWR